MRNDLVPDFQRLFDAVLRHLTANTMAVRKYDVRNACRIFEARSGPAGADDAGRVGIRGGRGPRGRRKSRRHSLLALTAKRLMPGEHELMYGQALRVIEKPEFNHGRFIGEVRRAPGVC